MSDWKQRRYEEGTLVNVLSADQKTQLGIGTLLTSYDLDGDNEMPVIRLNDGDIIRGCECWWIPVAETGGKP